MRKQAILTGALVLVGIISLLFLGACPEKIDDPTYSITKGTYDNGDFDISKTKAAKGNTITLTPHPDTGYEFTSFSSTPEVVFTDKEDGTWTFKMPGKAIVIDALFEPGNIPGDHFAITKGTITPAGSGTVSVAASAKPGDTVTLTVTASKDYELSGKPVVTGTSGQVTVAGDYPTFTFTMPNSDVVVTATFVEIPPIGYYNINKETPENGDFTISPTGPQEEGTVITLTLSPADEYEFVEWVFTPATVTATEGSDGKWTFTMIAQTVAVNATFKQKVYEIEVTAATNGDIEITDDLTEAPKGELITVTLTPEDNYKLKTFTAEGGTDLTNTSEPADSLIQTWTFKMGTEKVTVSAEFELRPNYEITLPTGLLGDGVVTVAPLLGNNGVTGNTITIDLEFDTVDYRISDALKVLLVSDGTEVALTPVTPAAKWTFVMPDEEVEITVALEFIPWFDVTLTTGANGTATFAGGGTGANAGKARGGNLITVTAVPAATYEVDGYGLSITPEIAVTTVDENTFTFTMPEDDVALSLNFARIGHKVIFTDSAIPGLTIAQLTGAGTFEGWALGTPPRFQFVDEPGAGRNDDTAIMFNRGGGETSFQLNLASPMSMKGVGGLSFWARTSSGTAGIRLVGMGDAGNDSGTRVMTSGTGHEVGTGTGGQVSVGATWAHYVIPFPHPETTSSRSLSRVFFMKMNGSTGTDIFIDDIEFVPISDIELLSIQVPATAAEIAWGATPAAASFFNFARAATAAQDVIFSYSHVDGGETTIFRPRDMGTAFIRWDLLVPDTAYTYTVEPEAGFEGKVSIDASGNLSATERGAKANLFLTFNGVKSSPMALSWSEGGELVTVTPVPAANGTVSITGADTMNNVVPGRTVTINATVNMGYLFGNISVTQTTGGAAVVFSQVGTALEWTFVMPDAPVTVTVTINPDPDLLVIETFETPNDLGIGAGNNGGANGYWNTFGWGVAEAGNALPGMGRNLRLTINANFGNGQRNHMAVGRNYSTTFKASDYDVFSIWVRLGNNNLQANEFTLSLVSGGPTNATIANIPTGNDNDFPYTPGAVSTATFTALPNNAPGNSGGYSEIRIPMSSFVGTADMDNINGWIFAVTPTTLGSTSTVFNPLPGGANLQNNILGMNTPPAAGEFQIKLDNLTFAND